MRLFAIILALMVAAGCSRGVTGTPTAAPWEPCTLASDTLVEAGINPEIRGDDFLGVDFGWTVCLYRQGWYSLMIRASPLDVEQTMHFFGVRDGRPVEFGAQRRTGVQFDIPPPFGPDCAVALPYAAGTLVLSTSRYEIYDAEGDLCTEVLRLTGNLIEALPS